MNTKLVWALWALFVGIAFCGTVQLIPLLVTAGLNVLLGCLLLTISVKKIKNSGRTKVRKILRCAAVLVVVVAGEVIPLIAAIKPELREEVKNAGQSAREYALSLVPETPPATPGSSAPASTPVVPTVPTNQVSVGLEERVTALDRITPRTLRQIFPGDAKSPWKEEAKAIHEDIEQEVEKLRQALQAKLNNISSLSPAEAEFFVALQKNWASETGGHLDWPYSTYQSLLGAIVPGGYRDDAPAVMVAYLRDRLGKIRRLQGVIHP